MIAPKTRKNWIQHLERINAKSTFQTKNIEKKVI